MVISFFDDESFLLAEDSASTTFLSVKKPGCFGCGNIVSLPNMRTTVDMDGLSSGRCCTHKRATWMHRSTSERAQDSPRISSISSSGLSSNHNLQAWNTWTTYIRQFVRSHSHISRPWILLVDFGELIYSSLCVHVQEDCVDDLDG